MASPAHGPEPEEPTITFDNGVTLTMSQYEEYIERQLEWLESLPPNTPADGPLYDYWLHHTDEGYEGELKWLPDGGCEIVFPGELQQGSI